MGFEGGIGTRGRLQRGGEGRRLRSRELWGDKGGDPSLWVPSLIFPGDDIGNLVQPSLGSWAEDPLLNLQDNIQVKGTILWPGGLKSWPFRGTKEPPFFLLDIHPLAIGPELDVFPVS